jgi:hypothetical protein
MHTEEYHCNLSPQSVSARQVCVVCFRLCQGARRWLRSGYLPVSGITVTAGWVAGTLFASAARTVLF